MRKIAFFVIGLLVLLVGAALIIPSLLPSSVYKEQIQSTLSRELDRDVTLDGEVKLSVFPSVAAQTGRVTIANAAGFSEEHFASMDGLTAKVKLLPLLSKRVEIKAFILDNPTIHLEKNANGKVNWTLGKQSEAQSQPKPEAGPFKRDGRYSDIDPAIGRFALNNGTVTYRDAVAGQSHTLKDANLNFSLPGLSKPISVKGNVIADDHPVDLNLTLNTPRSFLEGQTTPVSVTVKTGFADLKAEGEFLQSADPAFRLNVTGAVSDMAAIMPFLPDTIDIPVADLARTVSINGTYAYDGKTLSAKGAGLRAEGPYLKAAYKGDATLSETPVLDGSVDVTVSDIPVLAKLMKQEIAGLDLAKTLTLTADMSAADKGFSARNINASVTGDGLSAGFTGTGAFDGNPSAKGQFTADIASLPKLITALKADMPQAAALGSFKAAGDLTLAGKDITVNVTEGRTSGDHLTAGYTGSVAMAGETVSVNGVFDALVPSLSAFANAAATDVPYAEAVGKITAKGAVAGTVGNLNISDIDARLSEGQLNGAFTGAATASENFALNGMLNADIPSLRALATTTGTDLPPNPDGERIFEAVKIAGQVNGNPAEMTFKNAELAFDKITGTGDFAVDLTRAKPVMTGTLNLSELDLRPYMAANTNTTAQSKGVQPWSNTPYNFEALKSIDGTFKTSTPGIITPTMNMGQSDLTVTLKNGALNADLPKVSLYGGLGVLNTKVDASGAKPTMSFDVKLDDMNTNTLLAAVAKYTQLSGTGESLLSLTATGNTQEEIMKSLSGRGNFNVLKGTLQGIDLTQFLSGLDQTLKTGALPSGVGPTYSTDFNDIKGGFTMENGVANIQNFDLSALGAAASGSGRLDLGNQYVEFKLRPRLTGKDASDWAAAGIPIKISGNFNNVSVGLDTDALTKIVEERAKAELAKKLKEQVGGPAGDILGAVLGGESGTTSGNTQQDAVGAVLGGLLGGGSQSEPSEKKEEEDRKKEPTLEDALGSLFGGGGDDD